MKKNKLIIPLLLGSLVFLGACKQKTEIEEVPETKLAKVTAIKASESQSLVQTLTYPATVSANLEAKLSTQMPGVIAAADFKVGDTIKAGQVLAQVNEIGSNQVALKQASSNQIKQAIIASQQAQEAYQLARSNYENILISSANDLKQAQIARDQAANGASNLDSVSAENVKSAQLAYQTAKLATQQAQLNLENKEKQLAQTAKNIKENASLTANSAIAVVGGVISNINNLAAFDKNNVVVINYKINLGALDSSSYIKADNAYHLAKDSYAKYLEREKNKNITENLNLALDLLKKTKDLSDATKYLFDKSISSSNLPQSSLGGVSLSGLQQQAANFQAQINAALNQAQLASQALSSFDLENASVLDSLHQAYSLTKKQEEIAQQNLNSLGAGNKSQQDQASFSLSLANNQYENIKVKLDSQILAFKTQMDTAWLQYNNASLALKSLYDSRSIVSPIDAKVFQKFVNNGDTVSAGQVIALVGQANEIKLKFFVEADNVTKLSLNQKIEASDANGEKYKGEISSIFTQADPVSKRFQVEASLFDLEEPPLLGTILNVQLLFNKNSSPKTNIIFLPLSAIEIGQNGNYIFIIEDSSAKKISVELQSINGEIAEIKTNLKSDDLIIIEGNKFLTDGQLVSLKE